MSSTNKADLKEVIANIDADVCIVRKEYDTVDSYLRDAGYFCSKKQIKTAVDELRRDPYYSRLIKSGFGERVNI